MDSVDGYPAPAGTSRYLVERYWPGVTPAKLLHAVSDLAQLIDDADHRAVRHVRSTLVLQDETVFSVFDADSAHPVEDALDRAGWPHDRILEVVELPG